jgi:NAD(P)H-hydrate epimerase
MEPWDRLPRLAARPRDAHKGDFGRVLVVAGSRGMVGAGALTAQAALRSGAGLVTLATPAGVEQAAATKVTCATTLPLPDRPPGALAAAAARLVLSAADRFDVVALGPGLSVHAASAVRTLVPRLRLPLVLDADGLSALAGRAALLRRRRAPTVVTPHLGEMAGLTGRPVAAIQARRVETAAAHAREWRCIVLLKGAGTVVTDGRRVYVNRTGNPGMATGGSGDVLTGVIAALIGQGLPAFEAAALGARLHGRAGDLAARERGEVSLIATDLLETLPRAFRSHARSR